jgi:hypothetical protein
MTKQRSARTRLKRGTSVRHGKCAITPTQAEFMMDIRKHQIRAREGPTGEDLVNEERSIAMVRKLAMMLSRCDPPFVESQSSSARSEISKPKQRTVTVTRYYLTEQSFVRWPRTARLLLECKRFPCDVNGNVSKGHFAAHLKGKYGFTQKKIEEDLAYTIERDYITQYPSGLSPGLRIEAELQWLELLAREHQPKNTQ